MAATILRPVVVPGPLDYGPIPPPLDSGSMPPPPPRRPFFDRDPSSSLGKRSHGLVTTYNGGGMDTKTEERPFIIEEEEEKEEQANEIDKKTKQEDASSRMGPIIGSRPNGFPTGSDLWCIFQLGCRLASYAQFSNYDVILNPLLYVPASFQIQFPDGLVDGDANITDRTRTMEVVRWMLLSHPPAESWIATTMAVFQYNSFLDYAVSRASLMDVIRAEKDLTQFAMYAVVVRGNLSGSQRGVYRSEQTRMDTANTTASFMAHFRNWRR